MGVLIFFNGIKGGRHVSDELKYCSMIFELVASKDLTDFNV
jgi:hypothetical protein